MAGRTSITQLAIRQEYGSSVSFEKPAPPTRTRDPITTHDHHKHTGHSLSTSQHTQIYVHHIEQTNSHHQLRQLANSHQIRSIVGEWSGSCDTTQSIHHRQDKHVEPDGQRLNQTSCKIVRVDSVSPPYHESTN